MRAPKPERPALRDLLLLIGILLAIAVGLLAIRRARRSMPDRPCPLCSQPIGTHAVSTNELGRDTMFCPTARRHFQSKPRGPISRAIRDLGLWLSDFRETVRRVRELLERGPR